MGTNGRRDLDVSRRQANSRGGDTTDAGERREERCGSGQGHRHNTMTRREKKWRAALGRIRVTFISHLIRTKGSNQGDFAPQRFTVSS